MSKLLLRSALFSLLCLLCAVVAPGQQTQPSASEVLAEAIAATSLTKAAVTVESTATEGSGAGSAKQSLISDYRRDGDRFDVVSHEAREVEGHLEVGKDDPADRTVVADGRFVAYRLLPGVGPRFLKTGPSGEDGTRQWLANNSVGGFLSGYVDGLGYASVFSAIADGDVRMKNDVLNGQSCIAMEAQTKFGLIRIWLAQAGDFNPLRYVIERSANDYWNDKHVSDIDPTHPITSTSQDVTDLQIHEVANRKLVVSGSYRYRLSYADGKTAEYLYSSKRSKIDLDPNFATAGAFQFSDIPDGTRAYTPEAGTSGVIFEWRGGKIVPAISDGVVAQIDATATTLSDRSSAARPSLATSEPTSVLTILVVGSIAAIAVGVGVYFIMISRAAKPRGN
jgi:hypothetical protein